MSYETTPTPTDHSPGIARSDRTEVAMSNLREEIKHLAYEFGVDVDYVDPYEDDTGTQIYRVVTEVNDDVYQFEIANKQHPDDPSEFFYRALDRGLTSLEERLPDR